MRFLFTTHPGMGHVRPLLPVARALRNAGHEILFASSARAQLGIERAGFAFSPAGLDYVFEDIRESFPDCPAPGPGRLPWMLRFMMCRSALASAPDLVKIAESWKPDLVLREGTEFGACLAAEHLGIPHAAVGVTGPPDPDQLGPAILCEARQSFGLPPDVSGQMTHRYLTLAAMPRAFIPPDEVRDTMHFVRPAPPDDWSEAANEPLSMLDTLPRNRPIVHVTFGTTEVNRCPGVYETILDALRDKPLSLVLAIGGYRDPAEFGPQPANVTLATYISHAQLLPHCRAVICHGGYGTIMACIRLGIPMLIIPINADQPFNARVCAEMGVARVIERAACTPESVAAALDALLTQPAYAIQADRWRRDLEQMPDDVACVALLEQLARERRPIPRPDVSERPSTATKRARTGSR
jgi:UDP:flavonoid glycosyltransferase YjiC (YdhE family)